VSFMHRTVDLFSPVWVMFTDLLQESTPPPESICRCPLLVFSYSCRPVAGNSFPVLDFPRPLPELVEFVFRTGLTLPFPGECSPFPRAHFFFRVFFLSPISPFLIYPLGSFWVRFVPKKLFQLTFFIEPPRFFPPDPKYRSCVPPLLGFPLRLSGAPPPVLICERQIPLNSPPFWPGFVSCYSPPPRQVCPTLMAVSRPPVTAFTYVSPV